MNTMNIHNNVVETTESLELNELRYQLGVHEDLVQETRVALRNFEYKPSDEEYNDWLDTLYGTVFVAGTEYDTSDLLASTDPVAYRETREEFIDSVDVTDLDEYKELEQELAEFEYTVERIKAQIADLERSN